MEVREPGHGSWSGAEFGWNPPFTQPLRPGPGLLRADLYDRLAEAAE
jgi:hypothetical protein